MYSSCDRGCNTEAAAGAPQCCPAGVAGAGRHTARPGETAAGARRAPGRDLVLARGRTPGT
eukprot:8023943-Alexandrium_andersonii.AAC.1